MRASSLIATPGVYTGVRAQRDRRDFGQIDGALSGRPLAMSGAMTAAIRDEAERLYAEWQLAARQRGRLHDFLRAITRARAAADAADILGAPRPSAWRPTAQDALAEARRILVAAR